jgi:hypothetical protein
MAEREEMDVDARIWNATQGYFEYPEESKSEASTADKDFCKSSSVVPQVPVHTKTTMMMIQSSSTSSGFLLTPQRLMENTTTIRNEGSATSRFCDKRPRSHVPPTQPLSKSPPHPIGTCSRPGRIFVG